MNFRSLGYLVITAALLGAGAGYWGGRIGLETGAPGEDATSAGEADSEKRRPLFYRSPMNPSVTSPVPAKDAMGMDYIPVYAGDEKRDQPAGTVRIDPVVSQNIGVRTATAEKVDLARDVRAVGRIGFDEEHLARLHPKVAGWVERLRIDKTGERVHKDDILMDIYSPELVASEEEYLLALKNQRMLADSPFAEIRQGARELAQSARERLRLFDVPAHQIRELEESGRAHKQMHIHSPFDGVVIKVGAREGQYITPQTELYHIADLSTVWVYVDVFEDDLPWVNVGDQAEIRVAAVPGRRFKGKITYIYPYLEARTRTVKVRMVFPNPDGLLKPEMFAEVSIQASRRRGAIVVPTEAVIRSGTREQLFVIDRDGSFVPRPVVLGVSSGGMTQILEGIAAGERVLTSAQFLIDSESKLNEATAKMLADQLLRQADGPGQEAPTPSGPVADHRSAMKGMASMPVDDDPSMSGMSMEGMDGGQEMLP